MINPTYPTYNWGYKLLTGTIHQVGTLRKKSPLHLVAAETAVCRLASWTRVACLEKKPSATEDVGEKHGQNRCQSNDIVL